jgi:hypothetical protein
MHGCSFSTHMQVLRQQMEVVQNQMQRLQAHREQEGLSVSRAATPSQNIPSSSTPAGSQPANLPSTSAGPSVGAQPSQAGSAQVPASSAVGESKGQPQSGVAAREGSSDAEEIRQRRLNHFHTG